ncbi:MAG: ATPase, partial [Rhodobacteraceae bacterium]|nr:ATPase [Paracoccaceae bacterium]
AIDKVAPQHAAVAAILAEYGGSDLICYRAEGPMSLVARQAMVWDDLILWARDALGAELIVTTGVMHRAQPDASLQNLAARVAALSPFHLAGFHDLVALSGSLVIALAVIHGRLAPDAAWQASRVDETWQAEQWGLDDEAAALAEVKHHDFLRAARFYELCGLQS